jgi:hypothetical protein
MVLPYDAMRAHLVVLGFLLLVGASGCAAAIVPATTTSPVATAPTKTSATEPGGFAALMQAWHGHTMNELFRTWGRPVYLYSDGEGGQIAVYIPEAYAGTSPRSAITTDPSQSDALRVYDARIADPWPI